MTVRRVLALAPVGYPVGFACGLTLVGLAAAITTGEALSEGIIAFVKWVDPPPQPGGSGGQAT